MVGKEPTKEKVMKIIIVGCGKVGTALASSLCGENNDITVIDEIEEKVSAVSTRYDVMGVVGNGATNEVLTQAGIESADLLIAVTGADELNLLCCLMAKKRGNCKTIARVRNPQYLGDVPYIKDELGLSLVINPDLSSAEEIARILRFPSAIKIETFAKGRVELLKFRLPDDSPLVGVAVKDAVNKFGKSVLICTVERDSDAFIVKGDFVFRGGDIVSLVASHDGAIEFFKKIKYNLTPIKDAIVIGADELSHYVCSILSQSGINLTVIEKNEEVCEEMSVAFPSVRIINANPSDKQTLIEEGINDCGAFLALGGRDEENVFLSLYAKLSGKAKLVTKVDYLDYDEVIDSLGLDTIISPRAVTAEHILRFVRALVGDESSEVEALYSIVKGEAVAMEFSVKEGSPVIGTPLSELKIKKEVLIASIIRGKEVLIPRGNDTITAGDSVVIVSGDMGIRSLSDILR